MSNDERTVPAARFSRLLDGAMSSWSEVKSLRDDFVRKLAIAEQRPGEPEPTIRPHDVTILTRAGDQLWAAIQASGARVPDAAAARGALAELEEIAGEIDHIALVGIARRIRAAVELLRGLEGALS